MEIVIEHLIFYIYKKTNLMKLLNTYHGHKLLFFYLVVCVALLSAKRMDFYFGFFTGILTAYFFAFPLMLSESLSRNKQLSSYFTAFVLFFSFFSTTADSSILISLIILLLLIANFYFLLQFKGIEHRNYLISHLLLKAVLALKFII